MTNENLIFYLKKDDVTYYAVQSGSVIETLTPTKLKHSAVQWPDFSLMRVRDEELKGIFRTFSPDGISFVKDGQKILRSIWYQQGVEGHCIFEVYRLNKLSKEYELYSTSNIDFSQANDARDEFGIKITERGLSEDIRTKRNLPYEIPISGENVIYALVDGLAIRGRTTWTMVSFLDQRTVSSPYLTMLSRTSTIGKKFVPDDVPDWSNGDTSGGGWASMRNSYFFQATHPTIVKVRIGQFRILFNQLEPPLGSELQLRIQRFSPLGAGDFIVALAGVDGISKSDISEYEIEVRPGDRLAIFIGSRPGNRDPTINTYYDLQDYSQEKKCILELDYEIILDTTASSGYRYYHYLQKLVAALGYNLVSTFLSNTSATPTTRSANFDNVPWNTFITSGRSIRGVTNTNIKASIDDVIKDMLSRWPIGIGIEGNNLVVEHINYFLNSDNLLYRLENVKDIVIKPATDYMFSSIKIGFGSYEYDELSGTQEPNTSQTYALDGIRRIQKEKALVSNFRADIFGWEYMRNMSAPNADGKLFYQDTSDSGDDNVFLLEIGTTPRPVSTPDGIRSGFSPYRPTGYVSGLDQVGRVYNLTLTPKRALYRSQLPWIKPFYNGLVKFQTTDKNQLLESQFFTPFLIDEDADINMSGVDIPMLHDGRIYEMSAGIYKSITEIIESGVNGYVEFEYKGVILKGFILQDGTSAGKNKEVPVKLLGHPDNDLMVTL